MNKELLKLAEREKKEKHIWRNGKNLAPAIREKAKIWIRRNVLNGLEAMKTLREYENFVNV